MARDKKKVVFYGPRKKKFGHHWSNPTKLNDDVSVTLPIDANVFYF
jgi:hypothetical protein